MTVAYVEDDPIVRRGGEQALALAGVCVRGYAAAEPLVAVLDGNFDGVVVTDVRLPGMDGLALQRAITQIDSDIPVILVTGHGDVAMAVEAMRAGAYDFIEKPFPAERLVELCRRALTRRRLVLENRRLRRALAERAPGVEIVGCSPAMERVRALVRSLGPMAADILIVGETGAGKEVVARALHEASGRSGEFVAVNCGAIPETVFESEVFGYEAGAFTGATRTRIGKVEHANGGTLFLDELESLPPALQVKLLRVLQEREVQRLGSNETRAVDMRVVAATKQDLAPGGAGAGQFRSDLYYRLNVATIALPPLRARREDLPLLLAQFLREAAIRYGRTPPSLDSLDIDAWLAYDWPGNARELRNAADRVVLGLSPAFAAESGDRDSSRSLALRLDAYERSILAIELQRAGGNVTQVADALGLPKKTLYDRLHRLGIVPADFRGAGDPG